MKSTPMSRLWESLVIPVLRVSYELFCCYRFSKKVTIALSTVLALITATSARSAGSGQPEDACTVITASDIPAGNSGPFTKTIGGQVFTFTPAANNAIHIKNDIGGYSGLYAADVSAGGTEIKIAVPAGYSFDLNSLKYVSDQGTVSMSITFEFGTYSSTIDNYSLNGDGADHLFNNFYLPVNDVKSVRIVTNKRVYFNDFCISDVKNALPVLSTLEATQVESDRAVVGLNITSEGSNFVSDRGIVWATSPNPVLPNNQIGLGYGTGIASQNYMGFPPGTLIYVRGFATNGFGTVYGNEVTFKTAPGAPAQPTASNVLPNSFTLNWAATTGADSYRLDVFTDPGLGTYFPGYQNLTVNGTSATVSGTANSTTYYFRIRAVNATGTGNNSNSNQQETAVGTSYVVVNTDNNGNGSFSDAVRAANRSSGGFSITFNIPGTAPFLIKPTYLPLITSKVKIDGTTQPGYTTAPLIQYDGSGAGLSVASSAQGSEIRGLSVTGSPNGILMSASGIIAGNYIGIKPDGVTAAANSTGITVSASSGEVLIGGPAAGDRNIISGNGTSGIIVISAATNGLKIQNNYIGTDYTGTVSIQNRNEGISVTSANGVMIGTNSDDVNDAAEGNLISGNGGSGINIVSGQNHQIAGNRIGTNVAGTSALKNGNYGINLSASASNITVGGAKAASRNILSGNGWAGLSTSSTNSTIYNNYFGTDVTGMQAIGNGSVDASYGNLYVIGSGSTIGSTTAGLGNLISGSYGAGLTGASGSSVIIIGNIIGLNATGTAALKNNAEGIKVNGSNSVIGGNTAGAVNIVSGNGGVGILIDGYGIKVQGNLIGLDKSGTASVPNGAGGIKINSSNIVIGTDADNTSDAAERNVISGNTGPGIQVVSGVNINIAGNYIGTDISGTLPLGNSSFGVYVSGSNTMMIGGQTAAAGNLIAANGGAGIAMDAIMNEIRNNTIGKQGMGNQAGIVLRALTGSPGSNRMISNSISYNTGAGITMKDGASSQNLVSKNQIHHNGGLGIDLGDDGVTLNDDRDTDSGPNEKLNFPILTSISISGGVTTVTGKILPNVGYAQTVELFGGTEADESGYGEGENFLESFSVPVNIIDGSPLGTFTKSFTGIYPVISAVMINPLSSSDGTTSEFSAAIKASDDATLTSLTASSGAFNPAFVAATTAYSLTVGNSVSSMKVIPTQHQEHATIQVRINSGTYQTVTSGSASQSLSLNVGINTIDVLVTAENTLTTKIYTLTVTRLPANTEPTDISLSASAIDENSGANATVGTLSATDNEGGAMTYALVTGAGDTDNASFTISGNILKMIASADYEIRNSYSVRVKVTDGGSLSFEKPFTITIGNVDETPLISFAGTPLVLSSTYGSVSNTVSFSISGAYLSQGVLVTAPDGFEVSGVSSSGYTGSITIGRAGIFADQTIYIRLKNTTFAGDHSGNVVLSSPGAIDKNIVLPTSTVSRAPLVITASNKTKTYGASISGNTGSTDYTASGLKNAETTGTVTITYGTGSANSAAVRIYTGGVVASAVTGGTFDAANYTITYNPGDIIVDKASLTITASNVNKTYGQTLAGGSGLTTFVATGLQNSETIGSVSIIYLDGSSPTQAAGTYHTAVFASAATGGTFTASNYTITYVPGDIIVGKANLSVTANAASKTFGQNRSGVSGSVAFTSSGLLNSESIGSVTLAYGASGATTADVGRYTGAVVPSAATGGTFSPGNYTITYIPGEMVVNPLTIAVTATPQSKVYGDADPALTYVYSPVLAGADNFSGTLIRAPGNSIGTYSINQGSLSLSNNYVLTYAGAELTITKKIVSVTAAAKFKTYGDNDPSLTYTVNPALVGGDSFSGTLTRVQGSNTGTYAINQGSLALSSNYTLNYTGNLLTIIPRALVITAENKSRVQGTVNPGLTAAYSGFITGENSSNALSIQPELSTAAGLSSQAGDYPISISGAAATNGNYTISYIHGILTVTPGYPTSVTLTQQVLLENSPAATTVGTLSSTSDNPNASFTYTLVSGSGSTDNALFTISGNQLRTAQPLDFETKSAYSVLVRSTTQYGLSLDRTLIIGLTDVNETPTLNVIANQVICYTPLQQTVALSGVSAGPDAGQTVVLSITTANPALFSQLAVNASRITYTAAPGASGTATVTVTVTDNGATANGGTDSFTRSFTLTIHSLPVARIAASTGTELSKGAIAVLTATGGISYQWANAAGILSGQNTAELTVRPSETTTYTVTAINSAGCSSTESITLVVKADYQVLSANNLMSLNGDGKNEKFVIANLDMYPNNTVKVFDRAGRLVFSQQNYTNDWNGTFKGAPLEPDTYYYVVDFGPKVGPLRGFITIIGDK